MKIALPGTLWTTLTAVITVAATEFLSGPEAAAVAATILAIIKTIEIFIRRNVPVDDTVSIMRSGVERKPNLFWRWLFG